MLFRSRENMIDRLTLTPERIRGIADGINSLIGLEDPVGKGIEYTVPSGLVIRKEKVPLGVIGAIFEARPNVSADIASICIKSGNACVLKGGREAIRTNTVITDLARSALEENGLPADCVIFIEETSRECVEAMKLMRGKIDLLIPRGSKRLIEAVLDNSKVPVIETGAGNCHIYVHSDADIGMAVRITVNAKVSRPSVCNAAESLLVDRDIAGTFLPALDKEFKKYGVELRGCRETKKILPDCTDATEEDYYTEYNDLIMSCKIVGGVGEAVDHISRYSTGHSEAIVTEDQRAAEYFLDRVDSAAVYWNASTRFTDGGEFGLGAEIGISTGKLHVRGPMGLDAMTTDKYVIRGNGQIR